MVKNKLIITTLLGISIGLGTVAITTTVAKANTVKPVIKHYPMAKVDAVEALNNLKDDLCAAEKNNDINELKRLINKYHDGIKLLEILDVGQGTIDAFKYRENLWKETLAKKQVAFANAKKKTTPSTVVKPVKPIINKKETEPANNEKAITKKKNTIVAVKVETKKPEVKNNTVKNNVEPKENQIKTDITSNSDNNKDTISSNSDKKIVTTGSNVGTKVLLAIGALLTTIGAVLKLKK